MSYCLTLSNSATTLSLIGEVNIDGNLRIVRAYLRELLELTGLFTATPGA